MAAVDSLLEPVAVTDKHLFCVEMMKRLDIQRRNEQFCDVILEVGSGDDRARLKAHRIVLCAASPFFHNALNSDMKEKKGVIRLEETSRAVMEDLLEYLYTGHVDISEANACNLLAAADYFIIPSLKNLCGKVILQGMSLTNCVAAYCLSLKYQCEEIKKDSRDFIHANFVAVAETEDFLNLSKEELVEWISSDEIIVKGEEEVFEVLKKWATRNKSRKKSFNDLFGHIRCIYVPRDYLSNVILSDPMVKNNRDCSNLALDAMKLMFSGQEECYFAQAPRNCLKRHEDAIVACGVKNTWCYISSQKQWYKLADMLSKRIFWSPNVSPCQGKLFRIGSSNGNPAECYDTLVNSWSPLRSFQQSIKFCTVVTFQGLLHVIGGVDEDDNRLSSVQRYNPGTNLWQEMPSLSSPRSSSCAVSDGSHLYVIGGNTNSGCVKTAERFDPQDKAWSGIASTLEKRNCAGGAAVNHKVFVFGGIENATALNASFCEMYYPAVDEWNSIVIAVAPTSSFISVVSFKGEIFVSGDFQPDDPAEIVSTCKLYIYDTVTNEWTCCSAFPKAAEGFSISSLRIPKEILATCEVFS